MPQKEKQLNVKIKDGEKRPESQVYLNKQLKGDIMRVYFLNYIFQVWIKFECILIFSQINFPFPKESQNSGLITFSLFLALTDVLKLPGFFDFNNHIKLYIKACVARVHL